MLDKMKNHILGYSAILIISTGAIVSSAIYFLVIEKMNRDLSFLTGQNSSFQQQITNLQSTLANSNQLNDKRATDRLSEYKEIFGVKEDLLKSRIIELERDRDACEARGQNANRFVKNTCDGYRDMVEYISYVKQQEVSAINNLSSLHHSLYKMKSKYLHDQVKCEKQGNQINNACEIASSGKGKVEALESEIETKKQYLAQLNQQLLKFNNKIGANKNLY
jgi:chromosome segregation ATPase